MPDLDTNSAESASLEATKSSQTSPLWSEDLFKPLSDRMPFSRPEPLANSLLSHSAETMSRTETISSTRETTTDKILREIEVVGGGTLDGTISSAGDALSDPSSLLKIGTGALLAGGMTLLEGKKGLLRTAARVGGLSLAAAFATDVAGKTGELSETIRETWKSPYAASSNRARVAEIMGPFVVDTGLYGLGGAAGVGLARPHTNLLGKLSLAKPQPLSKAVPLSELTTEAGASRIPKIVADSGIGSSPVRPLAGMIEVPMLRLGSPGRTPELLAVTRDTPSARIFEQTRGSVGRLEVLASKHGAMEGKFGSSVVISKDGLLVTNAHVTENAVAISVFDAKGIPHPAKVLLQDATADLALIQLRDSRSLSAFKPLEVREVKSAGSIIDSEQIMALGFPEGHLTMTLSPGNVRPGHPSALNMRFQGRAYEGNSGGPLVDGNGRVIGIVKSGVGEGLVNASPSWHIDRVLQAISSLDRSRELGGLYGPKPVKANHFDVDSAQALKSLEAMFGKAMTEGSPANFFHSKITKIPVDGSVLALKTEIVPATRTVTAEPIAINAMPLPNNLVWAGTDIPVSTSRLTLGFTENFKQANMGSINDPLGILQQGFNFRGQKSYLGELKPSELTVN